ncbi:MAG: diadenylate cyclase CdaA [Phaeodactylibacter sp.]|uniref:diadenylate cyclase CdaA n=1 Tax=Phaeodactylibacter sp. TaxID=1940289 RepID=UPI0032EDE550
MIYLFDIGFLPVRIWDVLDIIIVGYLMYQIYKLLRGNIAFNIFVGVLTLYVVWWLVNQLEMDLLSAVLDQFVSVGVIIIIIIFQPEVRRFLLFLGNTTLRQRSNFLGRILDRNLENTEEKVRQLRALRSAIVRMSKRQTGALIVLAGNLDLDGLVSSGVAMDADITEPLLESIFNKHSPLHDGAVIISNGRIQSASCVLPVSENPNLPSSAGLRHRAAVGITERANVAAFIVSEETGYISIAAEGELRRKLDEQELKSLLSEYY